MDIGCKKLCIKLNPDFSPWMQGSPPVRSWSFWRALLLSVVAWWPQWCSVCPQATSPLVLGWNWTEKRHRFYLCKEKQVWIEARMQRLLSSCSCRRFNSWSVTFSYASSPHLSAPNFLSFHFNNKRPLEPQNHKKKKITAFILCCLHLKQKAILWMWGNDLNGVCHLLYNSLLKSWNRVSLFLSMNPTTEYLWKEGGGLMQVQTDYTHISVRTQCSAFHQLHHSFTITESMVHQKINGLYPATELHCAL